MLKFVKHSRVSKQPGETTTVSNSSPFEEQMKGERTRWNISNGGMFTSNGQGSNLLRNKLQNPNDGDDVSVLSPSFSFGGLALAAQSASLLVQNDHVVRPVANGLSTKSSSLKDFQHGNNALVDSTTFGGFMLRLQHEKVKKAPQLLNNGGRNDGDVPRPPTLQALPL
jgi:hypothetical protein